MKGHAHLLHLWNHRAGAWKEHAALRNPIASSAVGTEAFFIFMKHCCPERQAIGFVAYYFRTYLRAPRNGSEDGKPTLWSLLMMSCGQEGRSALAGSFYMAIGTNCVFACIVMQLPEVCFHHWPSHIWGCVSIGGHLREGALSHSLAPSQLGKVFLSLDELQWTSLGFSTYRSLGDSPKLPPD